MSLGQPLVVACAVALGAGMVVALTAHAVARTRARLSSVAWAGAALAPILVATLTLIALLTPQPFAAGCHCALHADHHPHLCWVHPDLASTAAFPAFGLVLIWLAMQSVPFFGALSVSLRSSRLASQIGKARVARMDGVFVHVLDCGESTAFTAGLWSPHIVVDRTLWNDLDAKSLRAVVHHERAHADRQDGLTLAALRLAAACFPAAILRPVLERWTAASEMECDRHAARVLGSAPDVASALIAVERIRARSPALQPRVAPSISSADLARRVRGLLEDGAPPPRLANDALSIVIASTGLALLVALSPGDTVHHIVETLLGVAVHR